MIERKSKTYSFNTPPEEIESVEAGESGGSGAPMGETMEEGEPGEGKPAAGGEATIPMSALGGKTVNPGDVVRMEVVNADPGSGVVTLRYAEPKKEMM